MDRSRVGDDRQWRPHPVRAAALRTLAFALPLLVSVVVGLAVGALLPAPSGVLGLVGWWVAVLGSSTVAVYATDRLTRRVLPLATLMRLSILFPDRAPSRLKVARKVSGSRAIAAELARAGMAADRQEAAETILALVGALGDYDARTRGHSERTQLFVTMLADELKLSPEDKGKVMWAALVHDIGKLKVPHEVLNKPAAPSQDEWRVLRSHPHQGAEICEPLREWLGPWWLAIEQHHERFDGMGYPRGLADREISYGARIVAVADSYEVMTAARPYKRPMTALAARAELTANAGTQFDPEIVRAFLNISIGGVRRTIGPLAWLAQILMVRPGPILGQVLGVASGAVGAAATILGLNLAPGVASAEPLTAAPARPVVTAPAEEPGTPASDPTPTPTAPPTLRPTPGPTPPAPTTPPLPTALPTPFVPVPSAPAPSAPAPTPTPTPSPSARPTPTPTPTPAPDPFVVVDDVASTPEDTPTTVDVLVNDTLAGTSHVVAVGAPTSGSATVVGDQVVYTPDPDANGSDQFGYTVEAFDGRLGSALVTVTVAPVEDQPVATADAPVVVEDAGDTPLGLLANDTDVDGDSLTVTSVTAASHGTATLVGGDVSYRPDPDWSGTDAVTYTVSDGHGGTGSGTATVTVTPVDDAPVAVADSASLAEDSGSVTLTDLLANDIDVDGDTLTVTGVTGAVHGTTGEPLPGVFTYTPELDFAGVETLTYDVSDGQGGTASGTVTVTVTPVNDPPTAGDASVTAAEDAVDVPLGLPVGATDVDGDTVTVTSVSAPGHGTVTESAGAWTYTPDPDWNGVESLTYAVSDGQGGTASAALTVTVTAVNDAPVAVADTLTVAEDSGSATLDLLVNDTDVEGDALTVTSVTGAAGGSITVAGSVWTYTPGADVTGTETLDYTVDDGHGGSAGGTVTVTVTPVEDAPVAADDVISTPEDSADVPLDVLGNDVDVDGDSLTVTSVTGAAHGALAEPTPGTWTYTPDADWGGTESLTYDVSDGQGGSDSATVTLTVTPVNDAPVAGPDAYAITTTQTVTTTATDGVLANDGDVDGDVLTVTGDDSPVVDIAPDGSFAYLGAIPTTEVVTYTVSDGNGGTATGTLTITVTLLPSATVDLFLQPVDTVSLGALATTPPPGGIGDYDGDGNPGLTIKSSDMKATETDPLKFQEWSYPVPAGGVTMNGPITMDLWTSLKNQANKDLDYASYVYDCNGTCTLIASTANVHVSKWSTTTTWEERTVTVGSADLTVPAGHTITVRLAFNHSDVWLPLDAAHPSSLTYHQ